MTEHSRKPRASKRQLRATAWMAGGLAFATPFAALAASPKPDTGDGGAAAATRRPVRVVRHVTRRIVIVHAAAPQPAVTFVSAPGSAPSAPAPAPAPAPGPAPAPAASPPASSTGGS